MYTDAHNHAIDRRQRMPIYPSYRHLLVISCVVCTGLTQTRPTQSTTSRWYIHPNHPDDPELDEKFDPPSKDQKNFWTSYFPGSGYLGLLFAGKSEFIWVVDIRVVDEDQELWSVGNLLTYHHVLTTCRAITTLRKYHTEKGAGELDNSNIRVNYCTQYLWEEYKLKNESGDASPFVRNRMSGTRTVDALVPNVRCTSSSFMHDVGIIHLSKGISPFSPMIGYMPLPLNLETGELYVPDLSKMEENRWVCYVASFGRYYRDLANSRITQMNLDYKLKYRVYYMEWEKCKKHFDIVCPATEPACSQSYPKNDLLKIMCFRPRAKVGAICDHDKGAPLVCNGLAFGMVVRGVPYDYCHDLVSFPVIVLIIDIYHQYFASLISFNFEGPDSLSGTENVRFNLLSIHSAILGYVLSM